MSEKSNPNSDGKSTSSDSKTEYVKPYMAKEDDDLGYYFFPERNPEKVVNKDSKRQFWNIVKNVRLRGNTELENFRCRNNVLTCMQNDSKTQMVLRALRSHGCPVDLDRHISCEPCLMNLSGGYDFFNSQVIVCENSIKSYAATCNVISHELLHAFDDCRAKFDPENLEHLACTEVRAANLFHCRLGPSYAQREIGMFNYKDKHQYCVRNKAIFSIKIARNISMEEASNIVEKVFAKCYSDLEPFGRLPRKEDGFRKSLQDGLLYGYM